MILYCCNNFIKVVKLANKFYINAKGQGVTAEIKYCPLCGSKLGESMEIKQALEELNLYKKTKKRMSYIKERISELQDRIYSLGGATENLGVQGGQVSKEDKVIALMDKIKVYRNELLDTEMYSLCLQNDIERKIYRLREPYCSVLRGYYVENKSLEKLAVELNYAFDTVRHIKMKAVREYMKLPALYSEEYYIN